MIGWIASISTVAVFAVMYGGMVTYAITLWLILAGSVARVRNGNNGCRM